jgi:acetoin:2,6-dichlorophenolindophenol oxidoreductase subunit beta
MREITYVEAVNEALREEMQRDENVFVIGEDVSIGYGGGGIFGATRGLRDTFGGERVIDTPLSESALAGCGAGAALLGVRPVVEIMFGDFFAISMDQVANCAAKLRWCLDGATPVPVVYRTAYGAGVAAGLHHSQSFESWLAHVPGLKVVTPSTPYDTKGLLKAAIRDDDPVVFMEHKLLYKRLKGQVPDEEYILPIGKGDVKRAGADLTIIAYGAMVHTALEAAAELEKQGVDTEVIDPRTLQPLDEDLILESVRKTGRVVIVHEAPTFGGFGGELAGLIADQAIDYLDGPVKRVGGYFCPVPASPVMEQFYLPDVKRILEAVKDVMRLKEVG